MSLIRHLAIIALYFVIALIIVGQPPQHLLEQFIGNDVGDVYEMARNIWWFTYAIGEGEPLFYQTLLGYPDGINGIIFISVPLQYFPMWGLAFVLPLHIAYNLTVLFWMALNGWAMFFLMRYLLDDDVWQAALLAGLVYMAFPLFQGHLAEGHGGLMVAWAPPLYLWALFRYTSADDTLWRWLLACIVFFYLSTTGHILQSIYVLIPITGTFLLAKLWQRDWRAVQRIMTMGILASGVLLLVLAPAILDATGDSSYSSVGGSSRYSADALAIFAPSFFHPTFDAVLTYPRTVNGTNLGEGLAYIGVISAVLASIAVWQVRQSRWWLLLAAIAWVLSLGPVLKVLNQPVMIVGQAVPLPFALIQQLPGFSLARTPARFNFTLAIALAAMVGYGAAWLWVQRRGGWRYAVVALLAIGILWEYQSFWGQPMRSADVPPAIIALQDDPTVEAIFNIPYQHALAAKDALFYQTGHEQPLIAGQITRTTPVNPAKLAMLQATLDPALLQAEGASLVMLHHVRATEIGQRDTLEQLARQQLGDPVYSDERIMLFRVPQASTETTLSYDYEQPEIALSGDMMLLAHDIYGWQDQHYVWLQWQFNSDRPDTDVRFVHLVDDAGEIVLQDDRALGTFAAGDVQRELLPFDTRNLATGTYMIRTGWYDFTTLTNYTTDDGQAAILLGQIVID